VADTLPRALVPAQGIGVLMSAIEAFNDFMPVTVKRITSFTPPEKLGATYRENDPQKLTKGAVNPFTDKTEHATNRGLAWDINFNTANRNQLAAYFASNHDFGETQQDNSQIANFIVGLVVALRSKTTHGLSPDSIQNIIDFCQQQHARLMKLMLQAETVLNAQFYGESFDLVSQTLASWSAFQQKHLKLTQAELSEISQNSRALEFRMQWED
jgi:hypothetical protein